MQRAVGRVHAWRGQYGFVRPFGGTRDDDVYVPLSALGEDVRELQVGDRVSYELVTRGDGRRRARAIQVEEW